MYWEYSPTLHYTAPFLIDSQPTQPPSQTSHRRVKVGFISSHFFHHSVGLLTQGVAAMHAWTAVHARDLCYRSSRGWTHASSRRW